MWPRTDLAACRNCGAHFPPDQLYDGGGPLLCGPCFDAEYERRQDLLYEEWFLERGKEQAKEAVE